ncbi:MAG: DUF1571 domain-containing protein [Pirellulaceae bacterium]
MVLKRPSVKFGWVCTIGFAMLAQSGVAGAQETTSKKIEEPIFRVSKLVENETPETKRNTESTNNVKPAAAKVASATLPKVAAPESVAPEAAPHPLDPALDIAYSGLDNMVNNIHDYTATMVKREALNGRVGDQEYINVKVRNDRELDGDKQPFSIYMKFLKPVAGREVIYVEGGNDGNMLVYEPGLATGIRTHELKPDSWLAMRGNRHPIYEAGLENLVRRLITVAERDREAGVCEVEFRENAKINGRSCTMIQVTHPVRKDPYDFHKAQVFIDDELQVPVRYAAYDWPVAEGKQPQLIEEYTYINIQLNVGLTDDDFDPANDSYRFPGY